MLSAGIGQWYVEPIQFAGPNSDLKRKVVTRFFMGYYPSKICTLLNIILMVGWGTIDCIIGGQVLSAVSGGTMTIAVGVIIVALVELVIAAFGLRVFALYQRYVTPYKPRVTLISWIIDSLGYRSCLSSSS